MPEESVVDRLALAILKARPTESVSVPAGAEPSDADSLARAILDARKARSRADSNAASNALGD